MEIAKELVNALISWPMAAIVALLALRNPIQMLIERLIKSESGKAKVGPVEIELGKVAEEGKQAVRNLNQINYLMAESRILELEITEGSFGSVLSPDQRERMKNQIDELRKLTSTLTN